MNCPLCLSNRVELISTVLANELIDHWQSRLGIDISAELAEFDQIGLYKCENCDLRFFPSELAGSDRIYAQLERFDWYYMAQKWEYDVAIQDVRHGDRVLEIGSGYGEFLERLTSAKGVDAYGLELSPSAAGEAQRLGRPVRHDSYERIAEEQASEFDVVCSFQVLEHLRDPRGFMSACSKLLKPGGHLLIGVPNSDGFIRLADGLLNKPPHHVTLWSKQVFESLPRHFPLELEKLLYEPLAPYHLDWYTKVQLDRLPRITPLTEIVCGLAKGVWLPVARRTEWYRLIRGHTMYVSYRKPGGRQ